MNTQSARKRREDENGSEITVDRLSQLPQPILHHILSLLPQKDAVRTSVLSKSWRYLWHGRLDVELCDNLFARKKEFWSFLDKTLQRYLHQNLSLKKFTVDIQFEVDVALLQKWIPIVITNMGLKSLNLIFSCNSILFPLPVVVFQSESLVELHLQWRDLNTLKSTDDVMLINLRTLRLHSVYITDEIFDKILSGCPLIENLDLLFCNFLKSIKLRKHCNIKKFRCMSLEEIIIGIENTHTLESVHIRNCWDWFFRHTNTHFPHLKSLNLHSVQLSETFDNFSSFFPCLNELVLDSCHGLKEIRLLSSSIKRLTIRMDSINPVERMKAFIDTPNLLYFEYSCGDAVLPSIEFTTMFNEWKSKISLWYKVLRSDKKFLKLNKLLKALSQSHITLDIFPNECKKLQINDSYGGLYKPVVVEHLKLSGYVSSSFNPAILNCLFQICRPRYIQMDMCNDVQTKCNLFEYISKLIPDETGYLEEVSIEVWDEKAKEWHRFKETSFPALRFFEQLIRFQLTWKEQ